MPNVLLEAQTLKKFIISSDCPTGPKEILLNGKAGYLFKPRNYKKLANLITSYVKNRKKLSKKIRIGYNNLDRFDFEKNLKNKCSKAKVFVDENRRRGIKKISELYNDISLILLDDAFQHRKVKRNIDKAK